MSVRLHFSRGMTLALLWFAVLILNVGLLPRSRSPHVEVERMRAAPLPLIVRAAGNLEAKASELVRAQFDGPVMTKHFREGQVVNKGEELLVIGREKIRLDYQSRQDGLKNAQSDLTKAQRDVRLQKILYNKQAVAYSSVEDAQRALIKASQALRAAEEGFKIMQRLWNSAFVTASLSGTIVKDFVGSDKLVGAGKELFLIADVSAFTVRARVDELDIKQVSEGLSAEVRLPIYPDKVFHAEVSEVGATPDGPGSPEIPVILKLTIIPGLNLRPRLTADVRIGIGLTPPVLSVPTSALDNADGKPKVWVLGKFNRLRQRPVQTGRMNPDRIEIIQGLKAHEVVCVTADPSFTDGMMVRIGKPTARGTLELLGPPPPSTAPAAPPRR